MPLGSEGLISTKARLLLLKVWKVARPEQLSPLANSKECCVCGRCQRLLLLVFVIDRQEPDIKI